MATSSKTKGKKTGNSKASARPKTSTASKAQKSSEPSWGRKNKGVIFAIIAGGVLLMVVAFCCIMVGISKEGSDIKTVADFQSAVADKKAMNCLVEEEGEGKFLLQANKGFTNVRLEIEMDEGVQTALMIKDDATYVWDDSDNAVKMKSSTVIDNFVAEVDTMDEEEDANFTFDCKTPRNNDFSVPADVEFMEID